MFIAHGERIALLTDSGCGLAEEMLRRYDIRMLPLRLSTSRGEMRDRVDITPRDAIELVRRERPQTAPPNPEDIRACFRQLREEGCTRAMFLAASASLSAGLARIQTLAMDEAQLHVDVVDTRTVSCGTGLLLLTAAERLSSGDTAEDVREAILHARATQTLLFCPGQLRYLRQGGRVSRLQCLGMSVMRAHPLLCVETKGTLKVVVRDCGDRNAANRIMEQLTARYESSRLRMAVMHCGAFDEATHLRDRLMDRLDVRSVFTSALSPAVASHTGVGTLGVAVQEIP